MAEPWDILLDEDFDLDVENGDLKVGPSTRQHQALIMATAKGEWPVPWLGADVASGLLDDEDPAALLQELQKQCELDGMRVRSIKMDNAGKITLDAEYKD